MTKTWCSPVKTGTGKHNFGTKYFNRCFPYTFSSGLKKKYNNTFVNFYLLQAMEIQSLIRALIADNRKNLVANVSSIVFLINSQIVWFSSQILCLSSRKSPRLNGLNDPGQVCSFSNFSQVYGGVRFHFSFDWIR